MFLTWPVPYLPRRVQPNCDAGEGLLVTALNSRPSGMLSHSRGPSIFVDQRRAEDGATGQIFNSLRPGRIDNREWHVFGM